MYSVTVGSLMIVIAVLPVTCRLLFISPSYANKLVHSADIIILSNKSTFSFDSSQFSVTENSSVVPLGWLIDGNDSKGTEDITIYVYSLVSICTAEQRMKHRERI